jgi:hypothetical protein
VQGRIEGWYSENHCSKVGMTPSWSKPPTSEQCYFWKGQVWQLTGGEERIGLEPCLWSDRSGVPVKCFVVPSDLGREMFLCLELTSSGGSVDQTGPITCGMIGFAYIAQPMCTGCAPARIHRLRSTAVPDPATVEIQPSINDDLQPKELQSISHPWPGANHLG